MRIEPIFHGSRFFIEMNRQILVHLHRSLGEKCVRVEVVIWAHVVDTSDVFFLLKSTALQQAPTMSPRSLILLLFLSILSPRFVAQRRETETQR